ncbi:unnamed protein product [Didymodactylos carnosus]|uniref:Major facilitator superfamily (MFS) profile domain-containing protein n=1 Tax=Didymodactylos carnosus TaxID=1234261 RepID=A0A815DGG1_9BILA|nr:unnamed protein product [Didymodactylos carnosus]CAF4116000.1 unnamed protein product [Didymodactylos carnosus]
MVKEEFKVAKIVDMPIKVEVPLCCSLRITLAIIAFLGFFLCYAQRNGLSVGIVCMVNQPMNSSDQQKVIRSFPPECKYDEKTSLRSPNQVLNWSKQTQGVILGSFYWGYMLTQVAGGIAVNYLGPQKFIAIVVFLSSLCTLLLPMVALVNSAIVIILRVITGASQESLCL